MEQVLEQIRNAGFNYAKDFFDKWNEYFDLEGDSPYKDSLDSAGHPKEEIFIEQMGDQAWQCCVCDNFNNNEFYKKFHIQVPLLIAEHIDEINKDTSGDFIYDVFCDGIEKFVNETYHNA